MDELNSENIKCREADVDIIGLIRLQLKSHSRRVCHVSFASLSDFLRLCGGK